MNERINGGALGNQAQHIQVNPVEAARAALQFLMRVQFTASERQAFDAVEAMLTAIARGEVALAQPPLPPPEPTTDATVQ